uniref:Uncharacterized protein n=1 Tax=Auxenochlorella protothecoides TaxID=3075 RepID=A0A1D1ZXJ7_AUXPR
MRTPAPPLPPLQHGPRRPTPRSMAPQSDFTITEHENDENFEFTTTKIMLITIRGNKPGRPTYKSHDANPFRATVDMVVARVSQFVLEAYLLADAHLLRQCERRVAALLEDHLALEASFAAGLEEQIISTPLPPREERPLTPAGQRRCEPYLADPTEGNCGLCLRFVGKNWRCMPPPPLLIKGREVDEPFHQGKLRLYETAQVYWSWRESAVPGYQPAEAKFQCHILGAEAALMETCTKNYIKTEFLRRLAKHAQYMLNIRQCKHACAIAKRVLDEDYTPVEPRTEVTTWVRQMRALMPVRPKWGAFEDHSSLCYPILCFILNFNEAELERLGLPGEEPETS